MSRREPALDTLRQIMRDRGVLRLYAKRLARNDNSKQQVYVGTSLAAVNIFSITNAAPDPAQPTRLKAPLNLSWMSLDGTVSRAPGAQFIYYPQYPEARLSGFLEGGPANAPVETMTSREAGRVLFIGVTRTNTLIAYVAAKDDRIAREFEDLDHSEKFGVFVAVGLHDQNPRAALLAELCRIHGQGWIRGKALRADGTERHCDSRNCGGCTLEAELGIRPNARSEPDFMGWEVKQFAVENFGRWPGTKSLTLMTPEPDRGLYAEKGALEFLRRFGYPDASVPNRLNFSIPHRVGDVPSRSRLRLALEGYNAAGHGLLTDPDGCIALRDHRDRMIAGWGFPKLLTIWSRKHAFAVYVPSNMRQTHGFREYKFGPTAGLGEGTEFIRLLGAIARGHVFWDPGLNVTDVLVQPKVKPRNQFRVRIQHVGALYQRFGLATVCDAP